MVSTPHFSYVNQWYLCSSCATSESCLGWEGGHPSSPSAVDCPSEQGVCPSGKEVGLWRKASSDGPDWKTKPERCPCGCNTPYKTQRQDLFLIPAKKEKLCCARIQQGKRTNLFLSALMGGKNDVYYFYLVSFGVFFFFFLENLNIRITNCININSTNLHFKCMRALYCYVSSYWFPRILKPGLHGSARHACCSEVYMSRCRRSVG